MSKKHIGFDVPVPSLGGAWAFARKWLLPNPGTLVLMVLLALAAPAIASPRQAPEATSTSTISYQGRLADAAGNPLTGHYEMRFRIYDSPSATEPLWTEEWDAENSVSVSDGLFNVMLGSISPGLPEAIQGHDELYLGIQVGQDDEMVPRVQFGSVPFSMLAMTVPDGSITTAKLKLDNGLQVSGDSGVRVSHSGSTWGGGVRQESTEGTPYEWLAAVGGGDGAYVSGRGWFLRDLNANVTRMVVDTSGSVGIGTTAPRATLELQGCGHECTLLKLGDPAAGGRQYLQLDVENSDSPASACDEIAEVGRMTFRGDNAVLWVCADPPSGVTWTKANLSP